jgi:hypothetical protein
LLGNAGSTGFDLFRGNAIGERLYWHVQGQRLSIGRSEGVDDRYRALRGALDVRLEPLRERLLWRLWIPFQQDERETAATWQLPRARDEQIVLSCDERTAVDIAATLRAFVCEARGLAEMPTPLTIVSREVSGMRRAGWRCGICGHPLAAGDGRCSECGGVRPIWNVRGRCPTPQSARGTTRSRVQRRFLVVGFVCALVVQLTIFNLMPMNEVSFVLSTLAGLLVGAAVVFALAATSNGVAASAESGTDFSWSVTDAMLEIGSPIDAWYIVPLEEIGAARVEPTGSPTQWRLVLEADRGPTKVHALQPDVFGQGLQMVINGSRDDATAMCDSLLDLVRRARGTAP